MAQLMRKGAHAEHLIGVAHHDERMCPRCTRGKGPALLSTVGVHIDPAIHRAPAAHSLYVLLTQWRQALADQLDTTLVLYLGPAAGERRPDIVGMELFYAQSFATHPPVAVPGRQVLLEDIDQVVEHFRWQIPWVEREVKGRLVPAGAHLEDIGLDRRHQVRCLGVLEGQEGVHVAFPRGPAGLTIGAGQNARQIAAGDGQLLSVRAFGRRIFEIRIDHEAVCLLDIAEWIGGHAQQLFDLGRPHVRLPAEEVICVVLEVRQLRLFGQPPAERLFAYA